MIPVNPTTHQKKICDLCAAAAVRNEDILRENMQSLYAVVPSLYEPTMEVKISNHVNHYKIKYTRDKLIQLKIIKQLMYSNRSEDLNTLHKQVMATVNLFMLCQECHQSPQEF